MGRSGRGSEPQTAHPPKAGPTRWAFTYVPPSQLWPWPVYVHVPLTQQCLLLLQALFSQHGWFVPPQADSVPSLQMVLFVGDVPDAAHVPPEQHPPPVHGVAPLQHACPAAPQAGVASVSVVASPDVTSLAAASRAGASVAASADEASAGSYRSKSRPHPAASRARTANDTGRTRRITLYRIAFLRERRAESPRSPASTPQPRSGARRGFPSR